MFRVGQLYEHKTWVGHLIQPLKSRTDPSGRRVHFAMVMVAAMPNVEAGHTFELNEDGRVLYRLVSGL